MVWKKIVPVVCVCIVNVNPAVGGEVAWAPDDISVPESMFVQSQLCAVEFNSCSAGTGEINVQTIGPSGLADTSGKLGNIVDLCVDQYSCTAPTIMSNGVTLAGSTAVINYSCTYYPPEKIWGELTVRIGGGYNSGTGQGLFSKTHKIKVEPGVPYTFSGRQSAEINYGINASVKFSPYRLDINKLAGVSFLKNENSMDMLRHKVTCTFFGPEGSTINSGTATFGTTLYGRYGPYNLQTRAITVRGDYVSGGNKNVNIVLPQGIRHGTFEVEATGAVGYVRRLYIDGDPGVEFKSSPIVETPYDYRWKVEYKIPDELTPGAHIWSYLVGVEYI